MVTEALLATGYDVRGQYARSPGANSNVEWRQADFMTSLAVDDLVEGCDAVVNLAGELSVGARMYRLNVEVPRALLDAASAGNVRYFGQASSISVYGSPRSRSLDEASETVNPDQPLRDQVFESLDGIEYARTKVLAELALKRPPSVARVDLYRISKSAGFNLLLEATGWGLARRLLSVHGNSHCIYEHDCADAIVFLTKRGLSGGGQGVETFNVADSKSWTQAAVLDYVNAWEGKPTSSRLALSSIAERLKNALKYKSLAPRFPISMARISNDKLSAAGFEPAVGYVRALEMAVDKRLAADGDLTA